MGAPVHRCTGGEADWTLIGEVKNNPRMRIPIIGNGDVTSPEIALQRFGGETGVDAVMIGRGSIGAPWLFRDVKHFLQTGEHLPPGIVPLVSQCVETAGKGECGATRRNSRYPPYAASPGGHSSL